MKRSLPVLACLLVFSCSVVMAEEPTQPARIFDGKSFDGWEGNLDHFRIEKGAVVAGSLKHEIPRNEFLCTEREYGDFELTLQFKVLGKGANAGVQIRSKRVPDHHEVSGYQADLGEGWFGSLYDESRRNKLLAEADKSVTSKVLKADNWNSYRIRCEGPRIQLWINDQQTVDYTEEDAEIPLTGVIGLQIHGGPPSEAWYKEIKIVELKPVK